TLVLLIAHVLFSSRRRHTRSKRDWSSDVCSSDLNTSVFPRYSHLGRQSACHMLGAKLLQPDGPECGHQWLPIPRLYYGHTCCYRSEERRVGKERGARRGSWE